ncbi:histone deacetylase family protein [Pseudomarimonas arenosa]|uniref:Histone deacetylase family protein n=1 Tax=Pseudomarimonas arenosa TaxID=2774145 RepID=A0AAW3ZNP2_9GAMM|nr:histone deacetylase family protein [Pseudomarimonas arenosa]MBD8525956.1 histone deacetylase family protein [Pseudomarimonas arenosa]
MLLYTHPICLQHLPGPGHPEAPERLATVLEAIDGAFPQLHWTQAQRADRDSLRLAHSAEMIEQVLLSPPPAFRRIDADTAMSQHSAEAALRAVGAMIEAIDQVIDGQDRRAFCAVRPPGHHATAVQAMGFCLFNAVAIGALHALRRRGLQRVAVVDFDVHHGNGTQDILWNEAGAFYLSSHQAPLYPGTGLGSEHGGAGKVLNLELPEGADGSFVRRAYTEHLLPALDQFEPELILVSAGFDAHRLDPLAGLNLQAADYAWITAELVQIANRHAQGRIVSILEGGYSLTALNESSVAHLGELLRD